MKTFKFWVNAALVVATITSVLGVIALIVFQFMYGWHADSLSPVEALIRTGVNVGFRVSWFCAIFAVAKLLWMVYTGEILTKEPSKPFKEEPMDHKRGGNPNSIFEPVKEQPSDDLVEEPWVGGIETPAYKSVKDRLTEVAQTPTQEDKGYVPTSVDLVRIEHMLKTEGGYTYTKYGLDLSALWLYLDEESNHHIDGIGDSDLFKLALPALKRGDFKLKKS